MAAWAIEQHPIDAVGSRWGSGSDHLARLYELRPADLQPLQQAASGDRAPSTAETAADAISTIASMPVVCLAGGHEPGNRD